MGSSFSKRTGWDAGESTFATAVREARSAGRELLDLTRSNPTTCGFTYDAEAILQPLTTPQALIYSPDPRGLPVARQAVAAYYADHRATVDPDALVLTTSTSEAYSFLFRLLCDPGDEVLVAQPGYPLFDFLATLDDVRLRSFSLFYDFGWWIDFAELERRIGPRTRAILVVHPNNPTGHWTTQAEREHLRELCRRHGLALIVDEVFLDYPLAASPDAVSFAAEPADVLTFILSGISKVAGLPQMKAAWLLTLGPEAAGREALSRLEIIADTFLSLGAPVQHALPIWLASRHAIQHQILARIRRNFAAAHASGLALQTDAGWSGILRHPGRPELLIGELGVLVHPGEFYAAGTNRIVVSLLTPADEFVRGLALLSSYVTPEVLLVPHLQHRS